ncbi:autotransporter outer membrane beta-barrel domain-containing protein [Stenotrophomonas maltophilia]|uniref:autotransporter outer membrane beta-barrel domain-containing protein n=1 Tax=Stenotrophomonas maltophilia TaxID=40324 RepID=UPI00115F61EA
MNTRLADDASPADQLVIRGEAGTCQTRLEVANAGGAGALTMGAGIRVVAALTGGST